MINYDKMMDLLDKLALESTPFNKHYCKQAITETSISKMFQTDY